MSRETMLARTMVQLADSLVEDFDVVDLLTLLADRCVDVLDVSTAGLILVVDGDLRVMASSSEAMKTLELFELQADEGPCMDCYHAGAAIVNLDLASVEARERWPRFVPEALDAGYRSAHAVPMRLRGNILGALNMFRVDTGELGAEDVAAAQALADIATIAILQNRASIRAQILNEQLNRALTSRIIIEQAKGVLAERGSLQMDESFARLRGYARDNNRRLVDVAQDVITGVLGTAQLGPH
jgi:GAF domain-containing protein